MAQLATANYRDWQHLWAFDAGDVTTGKNIVLRKLLVVCLQFTNKTKKYCRYFNK